MQLDSVRELKALLTQAVLAPMTAATSVRALSLSAGPIDARGALRNIALGVAQKGGTDFRLAVRLQRREMESSPHLDLITKQAKGEVDVRYVGRIQKVAKPAKLPASALNSLRVIVSATPWYQKRNRPLRIGSSVGHFKITAGTLGCFVRRRSDGEVLILSNNHVLANENDAKAGDAILQPGTIDGGTKAKDAVGKLAEFVKLKSAGTNLVDAAVASLKRGMKYDHKTLGDLGDLAGLGPAFLDAGAAVGKAGRTTGTTRGKVTAFELDNVVVGYDIGNLRFDDQIEVEGADDGPFCRGGDSGSLIVDADNKAVALLFAGGDFGGTNGQGLTYGNPIRRVLDALKVDLLY
jgi:hypothetical protein